MGRRNPYGLVTARKGVARCGHLGPAREAHVWAGLQMSGTAIGRISCGYAGSARRMSSSSRAASRRASSGPASIAAGTAIQTFPAVTS